MSDLNTEAVIQSNETLSKEGMVKEICDSIEEGIRQEFLRYESPEHPRHAEAMATLHHSERISALLEKMSGIQELPDLKMMFGNDWFKVLTTAGLAHDLGKLDDTILKIIGKPGKPTDEEWKLIKTHPDNGIRKFRVLLQKITPIPEGDIRADIVRLIEDITLYHHTTTNGYPPLPEGKVLHPAVRWTNMADIYDAIRDKERKYNQNGDRSHEHALNELKKIGLDKEGNGTRTFSDEEITILEKAIQV